MNKRFLLALSLALLTLNLGAAVPSFAEDSRLAIQSITPKNKRRVLDIAVIGTSSLPNGTLISLSFGKKTNRAFSEQTQVENGRFQKTISLRGLVLPGMYDVQVTLGKNQKPWIEKKLRAQKISSAKAQKEFRIGQADDETKALKRMKAWVLRANSALTNLSLTLEQRTVWHWNILQSTKDPASQAKQLQAFRNYLLSFQANSKAAAMDLALYRRRLVFDPFAAASAELRALIDFVNNRSKEHLAMLQKMANGQSSPCPSLSPYLTIEKRIAKAVGVAEQSLTARWVLGPNATPEAGAVTQKAEQAWYQSKNGGFTMKIPKDWTSTPSREEGGLRLVLRPKEKSNAQVRVSILRSSDGDVQKMTGIAGWENWQSYQRISLTALTGKQTGARHEFRATIKSGDNGIAIRVLELRLKRKDGRILSVVAFTTIKDYSVVKATFEDLMGSVTVQ